MKLSSKGETKGCDILNRDLLKGAIRSHGMTQEDIAVKIGLSLSRFNAKINETNGAEFSLGEVKSMRQILALSDEQFALIFLN